MTIQTVDKTTERQDWEDLLRDFLAGDVHLPEPPKTISRDISRIN